MIMSKFPRPLWRFTLFPVAESFSEKIKQPTRLSEGDTKWIDGLRGLAACFIVCNHVTLSLFEEIIAPPSQEARSESIWQKPFIYLFFTGFPWVATFLIVSGWVNAIKPLKLMNAGQHEAAVLTLSSSLIRRILRLIAPVTIATIASWVMAQIGAFNIGAMSANGWMNRTSPHPSSSISQAFMDLLHAIYTTWTEASNYYDANLWCMLWFLTGSMCLYLVLIATSQSKPLTRRLILLGLFLWSWRRRDDLVGMPTYGGILLCDVTSSVTFRQFSASRSAIKIPLIVALFFLGWFLMSFPTFNWEWSPQYNFIIVNLAFLFPDGTNIFNYACHVGIIMAMTAISLSPLLQKIFSRPFLLWLGELSLPIYLIHGPMLRSVFCWVAYAFEPPQFEHHQDEYGNIISNMLPYGKPSPARIAIALPVFFATTLTLAQLWVWKIEPFCANSVKKFESLCLDKREVLIDLHGRSETDEALEPISRHRDVSEIV